MNSVLRPREIEHPQDVLTGFFGSYPLAEARELLWDMVSRSLCAPDEELGTFSRKELLAGYEALERLVEAAHCLYRGKGVSQS